MATPIRKQQIASIVRQALCDIFLQEASRILGRVMVTVTAVRIDDNLGLAQVYLSFLHDNKAEMIQRITQRKKEIRGMLGERIGKKLRRVPELQFYMDNSAEYAMKINRLLNGLDLSSDIKEG